MIERHNTYRDREKDDRNQGVGEEQKCLATHLAYGLVQRNVSIVCHGYPSKGYRK